MKGLKISFVLMVMVVSTATNGQQNKPVPFIETELMGCSVVPNYPGHPETGFRNAFFLNIGSFCNNLDEHWAYYYNQPSIGLSVSYTYMIR